MLISSRQLFSKTVDYSGNIAFKTMSLMISAIMTLLVVPFYSWAFRAGMEKGHKGDSVKTEEPLDGFEGSLRRGLVTATPNPSVFLVSRLLIWFT